MSENAFERGLDTQLTYQQPSFALEAEGGKVIFSLPDSVGTSESPDSTEDIKLPELEEAQEEEDVQLPPNRWKSGAVVGIEAGLPRGDRD